MYIGWNEGNLYRQIWADDTLCLFLYILIFLNRAHDYLRPLIPSFFGPPSDPLVVVAIGQAGELKYDATAKDDIGPSDLIPL